MLQLSGLGVEEYRYSPIDPYKDQIRLIEIHPGLPGDGIEISLLTVSLYGPTKYEALSYVWGNFAFADTETISVDGKSLAIARNLFNAFHTLRYPSSSRIIWADAICINQQDNDEKRLQVSIMDRIYETAQRVVVYLGEPTAKTEDAMRTLEYFTESHADSMDAAPWETTPIEQIQDSLKDIINRSWFYRIWTVQEVTLARRTTMVSGPYEVSWDANVHSLKTILFRIKAAVMSPEWSMSPSERVSVFDWSNLLNILETQLRQAARRENATIARTPLDLAFDFRARQASDPRDKYFAIFNIVEDDNLLRERVIIRPDYRMSLEDLHQRFTQEIRRISLTV